MSRPAALVTGGARGIGRGIAQALAGAGFDVVVNDLADAQDVEATLAELRDAGARSVFVPGDVAALERQADLVSEAFDAFGRIDCLVNNAGVSVLSRGDLLEVSPESYDRCQGINTRGGFFLTQKVAKRWLAEPAGEADPLRSVVFVTSVNAALASITRAEYCISKTAAAMMAQLFAVRLAPHGIAVFDIRPGIIRTDMTRPSAERYDREIAGGLTPIARWGEPGDIGRTVATCATGGLPFTVGQVLNVDGGLALRAF
jgi:3-oxoacyl-[acyl-carrier protein] reductase